MKKFKLLWYDQSETKKTDYVNANDMEEAIIKGYQLYQGNPPAPLVSAIEMEGDN